METNLRIYASQEYVDGRFEEYGTPEDIVQQVIAAIGTPVFGRVDENNNIILTGELVDGTYTLKYEDAEGNVIEIGTLIQGGSSYTNMIPLSINSDGSNFVGANGEDGYKTDTRLNSNAGETSATGYCVTGYIPVKAGDVIYFKNINYIPLTTDSGAYIACYDSSFTKVTNTTVQSANLTEGHSSYKPVTTYSDTGYLKSVTLADSTLNYAYIRVSAQDINADSIITVNEPIPAITSDVPLEWELGVKLSKTDASYTTVSYDPASVTSSYAASQHIPVEAGATYTFMHSHNTWNISVSICYYDSTGALINYADAVFDTDVLGHHGPISFEPYAGAATVRVRVWSTVSTDGGDLATRLTYLHMQKTTQGTSSEPEIAYTNQIAASINSDGSEFVGTNGEDGYKTDTRLNSSGVEATLAGSGVTGFIPIKQYDVVRLQGIAIKPGTSSSGNYIAFYDASFAKITALKMDSVTGTTYDYIFGSRVLDTDGNLIQFTFADDQARGYAYMRVSCEAGITADSIITVNEEITE